MSIEALLIKNGLVFAFLLVGMLMGLSYWLSPRITKGRIPGAALAITAALVLAYFGGEKGLASIPVLGGLAVLGGSMFRDFAIVATAMGAGYDEIRRAGPIGFVSLLLGIGVAFTVGATLAYAAGYTSPEDLVTIGAGACTYIVGPVTGAAVGAGSDVIAISIATGVIKTVVTTIATPLVAKRIGLTHPQAALVFGGLIGTTSGVAAGLAATDVRLVPYGALTATFYTGLGVLLCPSVLYFIVRWLV